MAERGVRVRLLWLPGGVSVRELARDGMSPGLLSAGLGTVPAEQTYLDTGQGNRVFDSLYDTDLPPQPPTARSSSPSGRAACREWWQAVTARAESAPAEIVPGLLSSSLEAAGVRVAAGGEASCTFSPPAAPRTAAGAPSKKLSGAPRGNPFPGSFEVGESTPGALPRLVRILRGNDLLVAIARPTGRSDEPLPIGIAGRGFDGDLTSDSTRTGGYVLSTDLAPTILARFGIDAPSQVSGQAIHAEGSVDPAAIEALAARMDVVSSRRGPVIGLSILAWALALLAAALLGGRIWARRAARIVALSVVYLPLLLLLGAALEPGQTAEAVLVAVGAPLLAGLTQAILRGYGPLAAAAAATVAGYAVDVLAGSPLTSVSLLGPNPGLGVRFYGIGNELEALLGVLVVAGTGAGLAAFAPRASRRAAAGGFLLAGVVSAFVFAAGRFGADVGAAIVLPLGATAAAALVAGGRRRGAVLLVVAAPLLAVAALAALDLVTGANAHLTRSVLDAGGLTDLGDVAQRRLELSAHSFARPILLALLPVVAALAGIALLRRDRLRLWLRSVPALRAGLAGALAATLVGTVANDSGALVLEVGAAYLLAFVGYAWAEFDERRGPVRAERLARPESSSPGYAPRA